MQRRMKMAGRLTTAVAGAVCALALLLPPAVARAAADGTSRDAAQAALRTQAVGAFNNGRTAAATGGSAQAAALGDLVHITDPVDAPDPRGDIREVGVQDEGDGRLLFTMRTEQGTYPESDPAWQAGTAGVFWGVDTSGDGDIEIIVGAYGGPSLVFDATSGAPLCQAYGVGRAGGVGEPPAEYMVMVPEPGCFGDVKQLGVVGLFLYGTGAASPAVDLAPDDGTPVRFNRPAAGMSLGGYAIVSTVLGDRAQRFGAQPFYWCYDGCPPPVPQPVQQATYATSPPPPPPRVVGTASARTFAPGIWRVTENGGVHTEDRGAEHHGDASRLPLSQPIVGMAVLPDRTGYWLVGRDGGIFAYGNAQFYGSTGGIRLSQPVVGMAASPTGLGYWLVAADGGVFAYGDARFFGSMGGKSLNRQVVGMAPGLTGLGYWLVAADGGIFSFGVPFHGSTGGIALQQPIVGMATTRSGGGYRFVARDGGIFSFGDAEFHGSGAAPGRTDVIGIATV